MNIIVLAKYWTAFHVAQTIIVLALETLVLLGPAEMPAEVATAAAAGASGETNPPVAPKKGSWDM